MRLILLGFKSFFYQDKLLGDILETDNSIVFFGNKNCSEELLQQAFPNLSFCFLKQVHGSKLVAASNEPTEADAHWTENKNQAPAINTADCLPIMLASEKLCLAIHAGWKGLVGEIIVESIQSIENPSQLKAYIGPHIQISSFEVRDDISPSLIKCFEQYKDHNISSEPLIRKHFEPGKSLFNLVKLAKAQLYSAGLKPNNIFSSPIDTFSDGLFNSYRRTATTQRNISFCALKN